MHRIEIQKKTGRGSSTSSWEDVSNLDELKQALARYGSQQFWLEASDIYDETIHEVKSPKAAEVFTQVDLDWLLESETRLCNRYIAFKPY